MEGLSKDNKIYKMVVVNVVIVVGVLVLRVVLADVEQVVIYYVVQGLKIVEILGVEIEIVR